MMNGNGVARGGLRQRTLKNTIHCSGIGLHSGAKINMTLLPGEPNTGIVFRRTDIDGGSDVVRGTQPGGGGPVGA